MVKVWKSLDEFASTQLPNKYKGTRDIMEQVPNHDKRELEKWEKKHKSYKRGNKKGK